MSLGGVGGVGLECIGTCWMNLRGLAHVLYIEIRPIEILCISPRDLGARPAAPEANADVIQISGHDGEGAPGPRRWVRWSGAQMRQVHLVA